MRIKFQKTALAVGVTAALMGTSAMAQDWAGPYVGVQVGNANATHDEQILAAHSKLNPKERSRVENEAFTAMATNDWHKANPSEKREPNFDEIRKPIMMIGSIPDLRNLAIIKYEPERLRIVEAKNKAVIAGQVAEQGKSQTPRFDSLNAEQKMAAEWEVHQRYKEAHRYVQFRYQYGMSAKQDFFAKLSEMHGVPESELEKRFQDAKVVMLADMIKSGQITEKQVRGLRYDGGSTHEGTLNESLTELAENIANKLPYNPATAEKWRKRELEAISAPVELPKAILGFANSKLEEKKIKADGPPPPRRDGVDIRRGGLPREVEEARAGIEARKGCEWVNGSFEELNPSSMCPLPKPNKTTSAR